MEIRTRRVQPIKWRLWEERGGSSNPPCPSGSIGALVALAPIVCFASLLHTALICHRQERCSGTTVGVPLPGSRALSIWLNRRRSSLPLPRLVSPASSTPPFSVTGRGGVPEPQAALRLRSHRRGRDYGAWTFGCYPFEA